MDDDKRTRVLRKHRIDFATLPDAREGRVLYEEDLDHSVAEDRWLAMTMWHKRIIVISYVWRGDCIRLISARAATPVEAARYIEHCGTRQR